MPARLYVFEDNEAVIGMIIKGRSPYFLRHVSQTHRVDLDWLFHRTDLDSCISTRYVRTTEQYNSVDISSLQNKISLQNCGQHSVPSATSKIRLLSNSSKMTPLGVTPCKNYAGPENVSAWRKPSAKKSLLFALFAVTSFQKRTNIQNKLENKN